MPLVILLKEQLGISKLIDSKLSKNLMKVGVAENFLSCSRGFDQSMVQPLQILIRCYLLFHQLVAELIDLVLKMIA